MSPVGSLEAVIFHAEALLGTSLEYASIGFDQPSDSLRLAASMLESVLTKKREDLGACSLPDFMVLSAFVIRLHKIYRESVNDGQDRDADFASTPAFAWELMTICERYLESNGPLG